VANCIGFRRGKRMTVMHELGLLDALAVRPEHGRVSEITG
jgi:hypothetical protein